MSTEEAAGVDMAMAQSDLSMAPQPDVSNKASTLGADFVAERAQALIGTGLVPISFELPQVSPAPITSTISVEVASAQDSDRRNGQINLHAVPNDRRGDSSPTAAPTQIAPSIPSALSEGLNTVLQDPISVASVGLSVGALWWLTRAGGLIATTVVMAAPAWRHVDLLPVLDSMDEDGDDGDDGDDDSSQTSAAANGEGNADQALLSMFSRRAG